jgi:hypothetical protein
MKIEKKIEFFKQNSLFDLNYNDQVKISYAFKKKVVSKGAVLFQQGEPIPEIIFIANGELQLQKTIKTDLFDIESIKDASCVQKQIMKMQAKKNFNLENDFSWTQNIAIVSTFELIGVWEIYKLKKIS